ncbi:MAG: efflux RND transporter periplasmic adaptor subunit [Verrucomicrobia bacterium]|nr:efflux RND transporter periplasmic adaptor subunit [Verrucomicrobiota bacterium]
MKPKILFLVLIVAIIAGAAGWYAARHAGHDHGSTQASGERKIRFYQCSMHPQVKSDKPGSKCTICGMALSPIFEGQSELAEDLVTLSPSTIQVVNVQTAPVRKGALQRAIRVAGTIDDDDSKHRILSAYIDGRIEELFVNYTGAEVTQGEPLASFYSPNLLSAEREYLVLAQRQPTNANPQIQAEYKRLLQAAAQRLERLGLTQQQIQKLGESTNSIARSQIFAPMSGTVVDRFVYEGQYVKEGDPLFEIADFSTMWFQFDAYEQDFSWIKPGQKVKVTTPAVPTKIFEGEIAFIDPNVKDLTRSAKVRVELDNPLVEEDGKKRRLLLHRLYAEGIIQVDMGERLTIPRTAVLNPGGEPLVYVDVGEGGYQQRRVKLGLRGTDAWEVIEGVSEGESVVTYGNTLIDAQAQLNQSSEAPGEQHGHVELAARELSDLEKLNEGQQQASEALLDVANRIGEALAADDLKSFNAEAPKLSPVVASYTNAFLELKSWQPLVEPIAISGRLTATKDLPEARKAFHPFSMALAEFAKHLRNEDDTFEAVKIYRCPMVNQAVPGAPKNGFWIQLQAPLRNPYFGADMLECGTEVKP